MPTNPFRSGLFAALILALGLAGGWWLRGWQAPSAPSQTESREAEAPLPRRVESENNPADSTLALNRDPIGERNENPAPFQSEAPPPETDPTEQLHDLLDRRAYEAAVDLYQSVERQDQAKAEALRHIILDELEGALTIRDDAALTRLAEAFLSVHYDDIAVLTLLSRHQRQSGYWFEAARTFQLAFSYTEAQPAQRPAAQRAFEQFVQSVDQQLATEQQWQTLISFYETLEQLELSQPPDRLRLGQLLLSNGDRNAGRQILEALADHPQVGGRANALLNDAPAPQTADRTEPPPPVGSIPLERIGNHYSLPMLLGERREIRLVIDTGASLTTLSQQSFDRLSADVRFTELGPQLFNTAGGTSRGMVYRVDNLQIGDHRLTDVPVAVLEFNTPGQIDGLLGMDVLRHFRFEVDQDNRVLLLRPR